MENQMQVFNFKDQQVDIILIDGQPHFIGKQVATILGYSDPKKAIRMHVDEEDKGVAKLSTPGGMQDTVIINEGGMYSLIFSSNLKSSKEFKRWVTHEVLPSIRKTGKYENPQFNRKAGGTFTIGGVSGYVDENGKAFFSLKDTAKAIGMTMNIPGKKNNPYIRWYAVNDACKKLNIIDDNQILDKDSFIPEDDFCSLVMSTRRKPAAELKKIISEGLKPEITNIMIKQPKDVLYQLIKDIRCAAKEIEETFNVSHFTAIDRAIELKEQLSGVNLDLLRELLPTAEIS